MKRHLYQETTRLGAAVALLAILLASVAGPSGATTTAPPEAIPNSLVASHVDKQPSPIGPTEQLETDPTNTTPEGVPCWAPTGGPSLSGGRVGALGVHPNISGTLYASVQSVPYGGWLYPATIYQSTDGAANWTAIYTTSNSVNSLAVTGTVIYAGSGNRDEFEPHPAIYCSTDGGLNWTTPLSVTDGTIWTVAVHPTLADTAAAGGGDFPDRAFLYRTDDAGTTWTEVFSYTQPGAFSTVNVVLLDPADPLNWLLSHDGDIGGTYGAYILQSVDGGSTWTRVFTLTDDYVSSLVANPVTPTIVYASTGQNNLYQSTDSGATWAAVITDGSAGRRLVVEPPATLYATTSNEVRRSTDGGASWEFAGWQDEIRALAIDLGPAPAALYLGLETNGVIKSTDGGANWEWRNEGLSTLVRPRDLDIDPVDPARLFAAADCAGSYRSTDGGATWTSYSDLGMLPGCMGSFGINNRDSNEIYAGAYNCGGGTIYRSTDGGDNFTPVFTPTYVITDCSGGGENIFALGVAPSLSSTVYAAGADYPNWEDGHAVVVRSLDHGASWTVAFTLSAPSEAATGAISAWDDATVYVGGNDCGSGPCHGFVYRSTDHGDTWELVLTDTQSIRSIIVDYQKPSVLYAASDEYRVFKSTDSGDTWTVIREQPTDPSGSYLAIDPNAPSHVYLGGWGYIAESTDGGTTWSEWNDPINCGTPSLDPGVLRVDRGSVTQTLYAGFEGVWSYSRPAPQPGEAVTIDMWTDPLSGTVYANCQDGVFYRGLVLDTYENWVADGTPVTVTYDLRAWGVGDWSVVKYTANGLVGGGFFSCQTGTITFTAAANVTATAWVTGTFIYNAAAGITITGAPISLTVGGTTGIVTATLSGLHGGRPSNGTTVTWETSLGTVVTTTLTSVGVATTTLTTGSLAGTAVVTATAAGLSDTTTVEFVGGGGYSVYLPVVFK
jgi:photosystem II stability/assembly factor-like uncharacterized protein